MLRRGLWVTCLTSLLCLPLAAWAGGTILVYGDSLSAAYGLAQDAGWASLLQARLKQERMDYTVINASISGETTSGGVARIAATLKAHKPRVIIVELGANDGLRGLPPREMRANLAKIVARSQRAKARVLLVGMRMPPNYGATLYARVRRRSTPISHANTRPPWFRSCYRAWTSAASCSSRTICIRPPRRSRY